MSDPRFTQSEIRTLAGVLDEIIPRSADGALPGGGELGLAAFVEQALAASPEARGMIAGGLAELERLAAARGCGPEGFASLPAEQRRQVLDELAASDLAFVLTLMFHAFGGYYQSAPVLTALGLEARPPHPLGYTMEPDDLSILDPVRRRPPMYRR